MNPNNDDLDQNSKPDGPPDQDDSDKGFELDKLDIPTVSEEPKPEAVPRKDPAAESEPAPDSGPEPETDAAPASGSIAKAIRMAIIGCLALLILVLGGIFAFKMVRSAAVTAEVDAVETLTYHEIDPIVTNLGRNNHINIVVAIQVNPNKEPEFLIFQSKARDTILSFLVSPELRKQINGSGVKKKEIHIHDELIKRLQSEYGNRVVIRELRVI